MFRVVEIIHREYLCKDEGDVVPLREMAREAGEAFLRSSCGVLSDKAVLKYS